MAKLLRGRLSFVTGLFLLTVAGLTHSAGFPEPGKVFSLVVPFGPGGGSDLSARALVQSLEKALGTTVQVVNKAGAASQVGMTFVATSAPDGYTVGYALWPALITLYLDPARKASFSRKSFDPVALHMSDPSIIAVRADSPHRTLKDLMDAAKRNPGKIRISDSGLLSPDHLGLLQIEKISGVKLAIAHIDTGPGITALLGGHTDAIDGGIAPMRSYLQSGTIRAIAVLADRESAALPGVPTAKSQGMDVKSSSNRGFVVPAGTPKAVIETLSAAFKKAIESPEHQELLAKLGQKSTYMNSQELATYWDVMEAGIKPLLDQELKELGRK